MTARPTWKGCLKLSLVSCPVRLYNAVACSAKASFHLLHKRTHNRIQMRPHDPELGAVERSDLVKGYQYDRHYVIFSDADLKSIKIEPRNAILVEKFIDSGDVDPIYFEWPYYLPPDGAVAEETFRVIQWAMRKKKKVALCRIVSNLLPDFSGPDEPTPFSTMADSEERSIQPALPPGEKANRVASTCRRRRLPVPNTPHATRQTATPTRARDGGSPPSCSSARAAANAPGSPRTFIQPMTQTTTPVPVEGGVAGGPLPKRAGSSFHGRRKPNGSACQRRTMAGVQEEAKHAIRAMSPLKSCEVEKPQPQR
jgi:hypothetical protein